jgi:hypothetical protein
MFCKSISWAQPYREYNIIPCTSQTLAPETNNIITCPRVGWLKCTIQDVQYYYPCRPIPGDLGLKYYSTALAIPWCLGQVILLSVPRQVGWTLSSEWWTEKSSYEHVKHCPYQGRSAEPPSRAADITFSTGRDQVSWGQNIYYTHWQNPQS